MLAPFVSWYVWDCHCGYVFSEGLTTKHAMTFQNYKNVFAEKSEEVIQSVLGSVLKYSVSGERLYSVLLFIIIIGIVSLLANAQIKKKYIKVVLTCVVVYMVYMTGVACMYLFSMSEYEAQNLSSIDRYRDTIFIAIFYLLFLFSLMMVSSIEDKKRRWVNLAGVCAAIVIIWGGEWKGHPFPTIFTRLSEGPRIKMEQFLEDNDVIAKSSYLVCVSSESEWGYYFYVCRYLLWSEDVLVRVITEKSQLDDAGKYEYLLNFAEDNQEIQQWIEENYPSQKGKQVIVTVMQTEK